MNRFQIFFQNYVIPTSFWASVSCFVIWLIFHSGISLSEPDFATSLINVINQVSKNWGPIFAPSATIIFILSLLRKSLIHEIGGQLSLQLRSEIKDALNNWDCKPPASSKQQTILGIRSVFAGLKFSRLFTKSDLETMRERSVAEFRRNMPRDRVSPLEHRAVPYVE